MGTARGAATAAILAGAALLASACEPRSPGPGPDLASLFDGTGGRWLDLTHAFGEETIYWPTSQGFQLQEVSYGMTDAGYFYAAYDLCTSEHGGTHLDAPIHFAEGRHTADEIPLDRLMGPAAVVEAGGDVLADYQVSVEDLRAWEARNGRIPDGAILLVRTGWGRRWPDRASYLGTERTGAEAVVELRFPGLDPEAARWLVAERRVAAVGIDTASLDHGASTLFETHRVLFDANVPGFENVANLEELPETGSFVLALPMKIAGGSGAPLRIVAFVPG